MRLVMMPFVTPLVRSETDGGATHVGSGGYVELSDRKLLLTNDHVVLEGHGRLTHKFFDCENYFPFVNAFASQVQPRDLAVSPVDQTWKKVSHSAMAFPAHRFATKHAPVENELLFMLGFAGARAYYSPSMNIMLTHGTPYLSQEPAGAKSDIKSEGLAPDIHFALPWRPEQIDIVDQDRNPIPLKPNEMDLEDVLAADTVIALHVSPRPSGCAGALSTASFAILSPLRCETTKACAVGVNRSDPARSAGDQRDTQTFFRHDTFLQCNLRQRQSSAESIRSGV
jgi:hypothetical protein